MIHKLIDAAQLSQIMNQRDNFCLLRFGQCSARAASELTFHLGG